MSAIRGFTLLELLVALAVFAVVAVTVYGRTGDTLVQTATLEERTLGLWIAENAVTELRLRQARAYGEPLATGRESRELLYAGRDWRVALTIDATAHPLLRRAEVDVYRLHGDQEAQVSHHVAFIGRY